LLLLLFWLGLYTKKQISTRCPLVNVKTQQNRKPFMKMTR